MTYTMRTKLTWLYLFHLIARALCASSRIAYIEIVFCDNAKSSSVYSERVEGLFANIGSSATAQGDVLQIHPLGLCNISNNEALYDEGWVGVVKLTVPSKENAACNDTVQKALGAIKKGANAVIFDITDNPRAALQLNAVEAIVQRPVIVVSDESAMKLMRIVSRQKVLRAKISWQSKAEHKSNSREYVDMVIFMTCFILITITCFVLLLKIKWRHSKKESSLARMAFDAVAKMESKKYTESEETALCAGDVKVNKERQSSIYSSSVVGFSCVICLEEFKNGQELRVVSCGHEFHLKCVDPWLLTNYTCPLCMLNIVEREGSGIKSEGRCSATFRSIFRCCFSSRTLTSSSMVYSVTSEEPSNDVLSVSSNDTTELQYYPVYSTNSKQLLRPSEHAGIATTNIMQLQYMANPLLDENRTRPSPNNNRARSQSHLIQENNQRTLQIPVEHSNGKYSDIGDAV